MAFLWLRFAISGPQGQPLQPCGPLCAGTAREGASGSPSRQRTSCHVNTASGVPERCGRRKAAAARTSHGWRRSLVRQRQHSEGAGCWRAPALKGSVVSALDEQAAGVAWARAGRTRMGFLWRKRLPGSGPVGCRCLAPNAAQAGCHSTPQYRRTRRRCVAASRLPTAASDLARSRCR